MDEKNKGDLWGLRIAAVLMALLLFLFVSYENSNSIRSTNPSGGASVTSVEVLTDIPIEINIDREQYYVTGIPETATVQLSGTQSIITQTLATQNIVVETPNLTELGPGTHTINLSIPNLSSRLDYRIQPANITVTIEERVAKEFPISVQMDENYVADGYNIGTPQLSQETVTISGLSSEIESITEAAVVIPPGEELYTETLNLSLPVAIYDAEGELIDATASPSEIVVTVPIEPYEKTVPLNLNIINESVDYNYSVDFAEGQASEVTLVAPYHILDNISEVDVPVDVSDITESTVITVPLAAPEGVTEMSLQEVTVAVTVGGSEIEEENTDPGNDTSEESESSNNESTDNNDEDTVESNEEDASEESVPEDTSDNVENIDTTNQVNTITDE